MRSWENYAKLSYILSGVSNYLRIKLCTYKLVQRLCQSVPSKETHVRIYSIMTWHFYLFLDDPFANTERVCCINCGSFNKKNIFNVSYKCYWCNYLSLLSVTEFTSTFSMAFTYLLLILDIIRGCALFVYLNDQT